ncbi:hypothetical protein [Roseibium marinum]|uniref:Uncharacterized protein n=1 Tax=Roseibium marinum TaxID=281252 RepID=A0A2S3V298_9HYPH|nr:hypothetical protein [Roseibium marinum]POF33809.1 hypothetical protein CLV41_101258 [Roseibium marinum]
MQPHLERLLRNSLFLFKACAGAARHAALPLALLTGACQSDAHNARLESEFIGRTTAAFFAEYGPPDQVIALEQDLKRDATDRVLDREDPKELVYYWSSGKRKSAKAPVPSADVCDLAILTSAGGEILVIEAQDKGGGIEAAKARCAAHIR